MEKLMHLVNDYINQHPEERNPIKEVDFFGKEKLTSILKKAKGRKVEFFDDLEVQGWRDYVYSH